MSCTASLWCLFQVFDLLMGGSELVSKLQENTRYFRSVLEGAGFTMKVSGVLAPNKVIPRLDCFGSSRSVPASYRVIGRFS